VLITNIQRFSLDDGPGIRTTVFLAGCNMNCKWCHNPEAIYQHRLMYDQEKCSLCGLCGRLCEKGIHSFSFSEHIINYWDICKDCTLCIEHCPNGALKKNSAEKTVDELYQEIIKDFRFYKADGGLTIGGGEPMCQADELIKLLSRCKENGINIAVETAANVAFEVIERLMNYIDLFIIDCKAYTNELHKKCTGKTNELILENIKRISPIKDVWVRIPVIENVNITLDEMKKIGYFLSDLKLKKVELLSYHKMGIKKYELCGIQYALKNINEPTRDFMLNCLEILKRYGIQAEWSGL